MRQLLAGLLLTLGMAISASAQTYTGPHSDTFTFATGVIVGRYATSPVGGAITSWNGVANAYPGDMGGVSLVVPGGSAIDVPWQLGYLDNGNLYSCNPFAMLNNVLAGPRTYTIGDGTHSLDQFTVTASTTCPDFTNEYESYLDSNNRLEGFSVTASYTVYKYTSCNRGRCSTFTEYFLTGGTGTVTDSLID